MSTTIYSANLGFDRFVFRVNLAQASAPICIVSTEEDCITSTGWQTADARHDLRRALRLAIESCGQCYYYDPSDVGSPSEQLGAIVAKARIVESEAA